MSDGVHSAQAGDTPEDACESFVSYWKAQIAKIEKRPVDIDTANLLQLEFGRERQRLEMDLEEDANNGHIWQKLDALESDLARAIGQSNALIERQIAEQKLQSCRLRSGDIKSVTGVVKEIFEFLNNLVRRMLA